MKRFTVWLTTAVLCFSMGAIAAPAVQKSVAKKPATTTAANAETRIQKGININKADASTLAFAVKGFGPKRAEAIVAYRKQHGDFKTIDDLVKVRGIGTKFIERNREYLKTVIKFS